MACMVARQEKEIGLICYDTEFWVDTAVVQICKRETKFRTTRNPEVLLVNSLLLSIALQDNLSRYHDELAGEEERCRGPESNPNVLRIAFPDTEPPEALGDFLVGDGTKLLKRDILKYRAMFAAYLAECQESAWSAVDFTSCTLLLYKRLALRGSQIQMRLYIAVLTRQPLQGPLISA